jgi:cold shock CspA family protein
MYDGTITTVNIDRGFGFIRSPGMPDIFFHVNALDISLRFDEQLRERRVRFDVQQSPKGPRAASVLPAE